MKTATMAIMAAVCLSGCSTLNRFGITDDVVKTGVQAALEKEGLKDSVTDAQIAEVITILKAETRLNEIAEEITGQAAVQAKIEEAVSKYLKK